MSPEPFQVPDHPTVRLLVGDCRERMALLPESSVDAVVTDPPYGLGFMGKEWDRPDLMAADFPMRRNAAVDAVNAGAARQGGRQRAGADYLKRQARDARAFQEWCEAWAREALRVLKPGGHLLAFGGTRMAHRLAAGIEDAGFEVRDTIAWMYGSGFPKSLDVSKAIDKEAGVERPREEPQRRANPSSSIHRSGFGADGWAPQTRDPLTAAAAAAAGWGTALKPAYEPIVVARKALAGTVAATFREHGTGALNIDACRTEGREQQQQQGAESRDGSTILGAERRDGGKVYPVELGRWPANVTLDPEAAAMLDEQTGISRSRKGKPRAGRNGNGWGMTATGAEYDDEGGASRFFYVAKPDAAERHAGLGADVGLFGDPDAPDRNDHPTVKPIALMRWLCRLVTPGGTVLDPFLGSGTTACAALMEGFSVIGIEREEAYMRIARARIAHWAPGAALVEAPAEEAAA